jgi:peptidyl-prolyl cis-trans isomerase SurA
MATRVSSWLAAATALGGVYLLPGPPPLAAQVIPGPPAAASDGGEPAAQPRAAKTKPRLTIDRVVAVINDAVVLSSELRRRVAPLAEEVSSITDPRERERRAKMLQSRVLDEIVSEELILEAAREAKLQVTEKEVENALIEVKRQNEVDDEGLAKALEAQGYSMSAYREDVRRQILRMRAVNVLVRPRVTVTDEDVRAAYDARGRRSGSVGKVHLHHVLVALPEKPTEQQLAAAKARAAEVIERARGGEAFDDLAARFSDDAATAPAGGDLGWIARGSIATEWEAIVFAMDKGDVRGPISGPSGLHVFHVSEIEKEEQSPFENVKEKLRNELYRQEMDKQTAQWLEELRKRAHIEVKL